MNGQNLIASDDSEVPEEFEDKKFVDAVLELHRYLTKEKNPWLMLYQLVGEFIMYRKQNFTVDVQAGEFLTKDLYDITAPNAAEAMAAAFIGQLWPDSARSVIITPVDSLLGDEEAMAYFRKITKVVTAYMDDPRSGLAVAIDEYMHDQAGFGTSGIGVFENEGNLSCPLSFKVWDVKSMLIDEDDNGKVDTIINEFKMTYQQLENKYGSDKIPQSIKDKYNPESGSKQPSRERNIKVIHAILPRKNFDNVLKGKAQNWDIISVHILLDSKTVLKLGGLKDMRVVVGRFSKASGETYGRSPGTSCLPAVIQLNDAWRMVTEAADMQLHPPLGVEDSSVLGGGVIDTSPGAVNVFNVTGRIGSTRSPINPLYTVGDYQAISVVEEKLKLNIQEAFYLDRLLDFKSEVEMTAYETGVRDRIRGETLSNRFARQYSEVFYPLITLVVNILFNMKLLGIRADDTEGEEWLTKNGLTPIYIPDSVQKLIDAGVEVYNATFISPAVRMMKAEQRQNLTNIIMMASEADQGGVSGITHNIDPDKVWKVLLSLFTQQDDISRSAADLKSLRESLSEQQNAQTQLEAIKIASGANMANAQADATRRGTL